jgi:hypothetical protein
MKDRHIKIILKYVKILAPNIRKPKYSADYYLKNILNMLNDFNSWQSLIKSKDINADKKYHYKTIADIHRLWCNKGVYRKAYEEIRNQNIDLDEHDTFDLLIDSTLIINKYGSDKVGFGSETRKKRFTKLTLLTHNSDEILNVLDNETQTKEITFEPKIKQKRGRPKKIEKMLKQDIIKNEQQKPVNNIKPIIITTLEHDVKGIIPVLKDCGIPETKNKNLIGDAGYILNDKDKMYLLNKNIRLITPYRKNQTKKNTIEEKTKLKKRNGVERKLCTIKHNNNRIHVRKDRHIKNYMGFVYLGIINTF